MPIYEYDCPKCGRFDAIQKVSEKPLKCNPDCTEADCPKKAVRIVSASAFHLKGGGWYKSDYASSGSKTAKSTPTESTKAATDVDKGADKSTTEKKATDKTGSDGNGGKKGGCGSGCGCH